MGGTRGEEEESAMKLILLILSVIPFLVLALEDSNYINRGCVSAL